MVPVGVVLLVPNADAELLLSDDGRTVRGAIERGATDPAWLFLGAHLNPVAAPRVALEPVGGDVVARASVSVDALRLELLHPGPSRVRGAA